MIWRYLSSSVTGRSHLLRNEKGQDYVRAGSVSRSDENIFIGLVADGAGSTGNGGTGAMIACDTVFSCIVDTITLDSPIAAISHEDIAGWIDRAREQIGIAAARAGKPTRDYACTLIGAIVGNAAVFFQIGDGAIVVSPGDPYEAVFWPQQGEYANMTNFISDDAFRTTLMVAKRDTPPQKVALFSDGLQNLALSYPKKTVHAGFFDPLFEFLKNNVDNEYTNLSSHLQNFLNRDEIHKRNDDDKTLILALRASP